MYSFTFVRKVLVSALLVATILFGSLAAVLVASAETVNEGAATDVASPLLTTDKADYHPGETATIFGRLFGAAQTIVLSIFGTNEDGSVFVGPMIDVSTDAEGSFTTTYTLDNIFRPFYTIVANSTVDGTELSRVTFTDGPQPVPAVIDVYSQCANDGGIGPVCAWTNGNLNASNSTYSEGDATVQRLAIADLTPGSHTVVIQYDSLKSGKHAYDFLTTDTFSENWITAADLCSSPITSFASCSSLPANSGAIPLAPNANGYDLAVGTQYLKIRNATWSTIGTPTQVAGADAPTNISVTFNVPATCANKYQKQSQDVCEVLITFGAHISTQTDWGVGNSAVNISGSPYHVRVIELDGSSIGNRDNQMAASAIVVPTKATLTLGKTVTNNNGGTALSTAWTLNANGPTSISGSSGGVSITDAAVDAGTYTLSETGGVSGYAPSSWSCVKNAGAPVVGSSITLAPIDVATCTINNDDIAPQLMVIKNVINDQDGALQAGDFTMNVTGTNVSNSSFAGDENGTTVTLDAGAYSVDEADSFGYTKSLSAECSGTIAVGETKTCTITNNDVDVLPSIVVSKTGSVTSVNEPSGLVTYTFVVTNTSAADAVTIVSLADDKFGTLPGDLDCQVGTVIPVGSSCTFDYTTTIVGEGNTSHTNVFTAHATDNENNDVSANNDATVTFVDVLPLVDLVKSVDQTTLPEGAGTFNYTLTLTNNSIENVTITALTDSNALSVGCLALIGTTLTPGQSVSCGYSLVQSDVGIYPNTANVTVQDNENNAASDSDNKTVRVVGAKISVDPLVATNNVNEPHTFTVTVEKNNGSGWVLANGEHVDVTLTDALGATSVLNAPLSTCDDAGANTDSAGKCVIVFNSATPGTITVYAATDVTVDTHTMHRETDGTFGSSGDAVKTYIAGKIIVEKVTLGGNGNFTFSTDYSSDFTLGNGETNDSGYIPTGTHSVTEVPMAGWDLTGVSCVSSLGDEELSTAIELISGEVVTCTFTNTKRATLTIVKDATPNDLIDFSFSADTLGSFFLDDDAGVVDAGLNGDVDRAESKIFSNILPTSYTVTETEPNQYWVLGSASCVNTVDQQPYAAAVSGTSLTVNLAPGADVTCTFKNNKIGGPTRTQGFWQTHTSFTQATFDTYFGLSGMKIGDGLLHKGYISATNLSGQNQLFGAYFSSIAKKWNGKTQRSAIDKARMALLQQLVTAKLNCAAFGCASSIQDMIDTADSAFATGTTAQMIASTALLDVYNNSGDTIIIGSAGSATPALSKTLANYAFWDNP